MRRDEDQNVEYKESWHGKYLEWICGYAKTRAAFFDAAYQADGEAITLLQLMESMFELGFLDVSDMRWRTPTK